LRFAKLAVLDKTPDFFVNRGKTNSDEQSNKPQHNWGSFALCAIGTFSWILEDEAPPECAWKLGRTLLQTTENFKTAESPFLPQIESVIHTFCETDSASSPSKAVAYFLGWRSAVLEQFFLKLSVSSTKLRLGSTRLSVSSTIRSTIIPFPSVPVLRVVEWFFIDWWRQWGAWEAAKLRHIDKSEGTH